VDHCGLSVQKLYWGLVFLFGGLKRRFREEARVGSVKVRWKRVEDVRVAM
jgi:hypothetical protein